MRKRNLALVAAVTACAALAVAVIGNAATPPKDSLFAVMTGKKEVNAQGKKGVGDPNGRGAFSGIFDGRELCYGIQVKNIGDPAAAHIHKGGPNVAGPIVQALEEPSAGDPGQSGDCVELPAKLARAIRKNPAKYYVNVHTAAFPGGAVRGQLFARSR
jgi:CHRD domain